jgi:hypothetical protein
MTKVWWPSNEGESETNSQDWVDKLVINGAIENDQSWSACGVIHLTAGQHEAKIQFSSSSPQQTAKIRRARIVLEKF